MAVLGAAENMALAAPSREQVAMMISSPHVAMMISTMTANDELIRARRPLASLANHGQTRWPLLTLEVNGCGVELCARCWSQASSFSKVSKSLRKFRVGAASRKITRKTMSCANRYAQACCAIPLAYSPRHTLSRRSPKSAGLSDLRPPDPIAPRPSTTNTRPSNTTVVIELQTIWS